MAVLSSLLSLLIGVPAAYALSRYRMKRGEMISNWILSTRMAPPILCAVPYYILSKSVGVYDTKGLLVLMHVLLILSWVVWMMRSFFDDLPIDRRVQPLYLPDAGDPASFGVGAGGYVYLQYHPLVE